MSAAGATAASITMPLDFAKTVLQCGSELPVHRVLKQTLQDKGPAGLFTGMVSCALCSQALSSQAPRCTCPALIVAAPALCALSRKLQHKALPAFTGMISQKRLQLCNRLDMLISIEPVSSIGIAGHKLAFHSLLQSFHPGRKPDCWLPLEKSCCLQGPRVTQTAVMSAVFFSLFEFCKSQLKR